MSQQGTDRQIRLKNIQSLKLQINVGAALAKWNKQASRTKNRYLRFKELYMTEIDYQKDLITIRDNIKKPFIQAGLINEIEANTMFANVEAMIQLSAQLKEELEAKFNKWDRRTTEIGKTMTKFSKFMLVYSDYFKNLASTQAKIKTILSQSQKAREIQKRLSTATKIVTIQDLISKPFQRPLKYHLILRDYESKTPKDHLDIPNLKQAIECYHKVNQKNNVSMENKQKDQVLIALDLKFGNIIQGNTRSYIAQFQAFLIDQIVDLFLFSDLLLLAFKGANSSKATLRIHLDKYSYVQRPGDGRCFVNRLFVYGKRICVHLTFTQQDVRNNFEELIGQVITSTNINEAERQKKINEGNRITRNSLTQRRTSFTQLKPQTKRPFVLTVIGNDKRVFSEQRFELYFVIEITATPSVINQNSPPKQIALVSSQTILKLVQLTKRLYPQVIFYPLDYCPKGFNPKDLQKDIDKRSEIQNLFVQLFLNTIYRDPSTTKRLDFYSYYLNFSDTIWQQLKTPNTCALTNCQACFVQNKFKNYDQFFNESRRRYLEKYQLSNNRIAQNKGKLVQFCDRKTIIMIQALQSVPAAAIVGLPIQARLQWLKAKFGWINHVFTNPKPTTVRINVKVYFCNVLNSSDGISVEFASSQRVKQVINYISQRLKINLEDYTLIAQINGNSYLLWQDEQLGKLLIAPPKQEGLFNSFFAKQPYRISLWLRKIWYFPAFLEIKCTQRKLQHKTEQIIFRLKYGEIKLKDLRQYCRIYAWYYCFKHFIELDTLSYYLVKKRTEELDKMLPEKMREKIIDGLYAEIQKIKSNKSIMHQNQLLEFILTSALENQSGSCFFYDTVLKPDNIRVKIGCDAEGIKVRDRSTLLFNFKFSSPQLVYYTNGCEFVVSEEKTYSFYSHDSWKIKKQVDVYRLNYNSFKF